MKKIIATALVLIMTMGFSSNVLATDKALIDPYEAVLNSINEEYNLDLGYIPVDSSVSIEKYEDTTREVAIQQRELLDYIALREASNTSTHVIANNVTLASAVVKTRTKPTWDFGEYFTITATFTVYDGSRIGVCSNAKLVSTNAARVGIIYLTNISNPTYSVLDSGTTSTVRYTATIHFNSGSGYDNIVFYTEFYCSD